MTFGHIQGMSMGGLLHLVHKQEEITTASSIQISPLLLRHCCLRMLREHSYGKSRIGLENSDPDSRVLST